jgi:hypothetical protein
MLVSDVHCNPWLLIIYVAARVCFFETQQFIMFSNTERLWLHSANITVTKQFFSAFSFYRGMVFLHHAEGFIIQYDV